MFALMPGIRSFVSGLLTFLVCVVSEAVFAAPAAHLGLNKYELVRQYLGTANGGDGGSEYRKVTRALAKKAIVDARGAEASFLRVAVTGYAPSTYYQRGDLALWMENGPAYWRIVDETFDDLDAAGVAVVVTFLWNISQFPAMTGESVRDLIVDRESRSYRLASKYISEFIARYKGRRTILFYELTNELNLGADLDLVGRCRKQEFSKVCEVKGNYTTAEMIDFTRRLASVIRASDSTRPISSGFSAPRPIAEHLRARPEWSKGKGDVAKDTRAQYERNLQDIHAAFDVVSVHLYPGKENARFGEMDPRSTELLDITKKAVDRMGKKLFVGEFGEASTGGSQQKDSFTSRILEKIVQLRVPYSAVWAWEFDPSTPHPNQRRRTAAATYSLEPGLTDELIKAFSEASRALGRPFSTDSKSAGDVSMPRVVITSPVGCSNIGRRQYVSAVASDQSGIDRVDWVFDGVVQATQTAPPYDAVIELPQVEDGEYELSARAFDRAENVSEYHVRVVVGKPESTGMCSSARVR
jgi:hypothetical protein